MKGGATRLGVLVVASTVLCIPVTTRGQVQVDRLVGRASLADGTAVDTSGQWSTEPIEDAVTISGWLYWPRGARDAPLFEVVAASGDPSVAAHVAGGRIHVTVDSGCQRSTLTFEGAGLRSGAWHHVLVAVARRELVGSLDGTAAGNATAGDIADVPRCSWEFGRWTLAASEDPRQARIDDLRVYRGALSPVEHRQLAASGRTPAFDVEAQLATPARSSEDSSSIPIGGGRSWSVAFWYRTDAATPASLGLLSGAGTGGRVLLEADRVVWTGRPRRLTSRALSPSGWHHVVVSRDGGRQQLYVDGRLQPTRPVRGAPALPGFIGGPSNGPSLSPVKVFTHALNTSMVQFLYHEGPHSVVAWAQRGAPTNVTLEGPARATADSLVLEAGGSSWLAFPGHRQRDLDVLVEAAVAGDTELIISTCQAGRRVSVTQSERGFSSASGGRPARCEVSRDGARRRVRLRFFPDTDQIVVERDGLSLCSLHAPAAASECADGMRLEVRGPGGQAVVHRWEAVERASRSHSFSTDFSDERENARLWSGEDSNGSLQSPATDEHFCRYLQTFPADATLRTRVPGRDVSVWLVARRNRGGYIRGGYNASTRAYELWERSPLFAAGVSCQGLAAGPRLIARAPAALVDGPHDLELSFERRSLRLINGSSGRVVLEGVATKESRGRVGLCSSDATRIDLFSYQGSTQVHNAISEVIVPDGVGLPGDENMDVASFDGRLLAAMSRRIPGQPRKHLFESRDGGSTWRALRYRRCANADARLEETPRVAALFAPLGSDSVLMLAPAVVSGVADLVPMVATYSAHDGALDVCPLAAWQPVGALQAGRGVTQPAKLTRTPWNDYFLGMPTPLIEGVHPESSGGVDLRRSGDGGATWTGVEPTYDTRSTGLNLQEGAVVPIDATHAILIARTPYGAHLQTSLRRAGATWQGNPRFSPTPFRSPLASFAVASAPLPTGGVSHGSTRRRAGSAPERKVSTGATTTIDCFRGSDSGSPTGATSWMSTGGKPRGSSVFRLLSATIAS
jgi:hypothetical protein